MRGDFPLPVLIFYFFGRGRRFHVATANELLTKVEVAIEARLTGGAVQSYSIAGRDIQYVSLAELYKMRRELQREVNAGKPNGGRTYATFGNP